LFVAEENMRRSEEYLEYSKRLAERGYVPEAQLEADAFAVEKARKELGVAETKLHVLKSYTREKVLTQLRADIQTAEARLQARQKTRELDLVQLQEIEKQISRCKIVAPVAGQVVYANNRDGRGSSSSGTVLIEEGMPVRERQTIIRLPDPSKMRVIAKVHESRVSNVKPGLTAELKLDAMPDLALTGRVTYVSEYPLPAISVYMAHVKEFAVEVEIENPPRELRPGMTAEVNIVVSRVDDVVKVPIESLTQRHGRFYCGVPLEDGSLQPREVSIGLMNETDAVILSGLDANEQVVLNMGSEEVLRALELSDESMSEQPDV
jgi:HlyD family secretion protein